jgi:diguanylate cyclase (GGDEF)-like protein
MYGQAMFSAAGTPLEAILRATSREEFYQWVCDAVVDEGGSIATAILVAAADSGLTYAAGTGRQMEEFSRLGIEAGVNPAAAHDLASVAFHTVRSCFTNDYVNDELVHAWREAGIRDRIGAATAIPLVSNGSSIGVFLFFLAKPGTITPEIISCMERLAGNVSFALEKFEHSAKRERVYCMVSALSASNEEILRAATREKLYQLVCEAAVRGGNFTCVVIALAEPGNEFFNIVATIGPNADIPRDARLATTTDHVGGRGLAGIAFRTRQPCISNDYLADERYNSIHDFVRRTGLGSGAALPLLSGGLAIGILLFLSPEADFFTPGLVESLQRLAGNLSFALENFDGAEAMERAEEQIRHRAPHDSLTNLPNRVLFNQLLAFSLKSAERYDRKYAVLFIDLDRFKVINDSLGHEAGDALLIEMARRLRSYVRASDIVARLGDDEFRVLLKEITDGKQAAAVAGGLLSTLIIPVELCGQECRVTASIGVALFPEDGKDEQTLTKHADIAMYHAKTEGKNGVRFFSNDIKAQFACRLTMEADLLHALERQEFRLYYQPKLSLATREITGVEALLRWVHPELGLIPPVQFIPLAEETGLIIPIGRWVLQTACSQNMAWQRLGLQPVSMAIKVSPVQFSDENLLWDIDDALAISGMEPRLLQIELTESTIMLNVERTIDLFGAIKERGVRLAIDDFGTGHSSMATLKQFPVDTIKIDRSFVRGLPKNAQDSAIAEAVISLGKALGLTICAEGVETVEQEEFLRDHACDETQGFLFSRPLKADEIAILLRTTKHTSRMPTT